MNTIETDVCDETPALSDHVLRTLRQHRSDLPFYWRFHEFVTRLRDEGVAIGAQPILGLMRSSGASMRDEVYAVNDHRSALYGRLYNHITVSNYFSPKGSGFDLVDIPLLASELIDWRDHAPMVG